MSQSGQASQVRPACGASAGAVFRVVLRMQVAADSGPEFERTWVDVGSVISGHPASLGQWLMRSAEEDGVYYVVSDWADETGFRQFERSSEHVEHRRRIDRFRRGGWMTTTQVVHSLPGAAGHAG